MKENDSRFSASLQWPLVSYQLMIVLDAVVTSNSHNEASGKNDTCVISLQLVTPSPNP